ncbi:hypothetical protein FGG08_006176 [Glutinoglossum americanum]|uniref:Uncharacterized protein n=1 Tax=Glutinoglossum americanum TaxID=1670608 RepID=A0A9P8KXS0_9PEZI|nr:hypothetical protein FGG08_006176 [Glutinoglossum americanum]
MPRPKRTKVNPSQPASRRVAQWTPAQSAVSKRRNPARKASNRAEHDSDDSDGLVTSFSRKQGSPAQLHEGMVMMRGGLGFGDVKGAHTRTRPASGRTENAGHAEAMERLKMRRNAALEAQKGEGSRRTEREITPENTIEKANEGRKNAEDTPGVESSVLVIANFKRRARQPSILRSAVEDLRGGEDEDAFEPEDESTPLKLSVSASILQQGPDFASSSSLSLSGSNPRKRKLTPRMEVPRSSPPIAFDLLSADPLQEHASSPPSLSEARDRHMEDRSREGSETLALPRSSSPVTRGTSTFPSSHSNPGHQRANMQATKRQRKEPPQKTQVKRVSQDGVSDVEDLRSNDEDSVEIAAPTRNSRRKDKQKKKAPISTATLQNLLPRRRRRAPHGEFDIMESSDLDPETTRLNEPSISSKKTTKRSQPHSDGRRLGRKAEFQKKDAPLKKRIAAAPVIRAPRTYERRISSDKENDGLPSSSVEEGDSLAPIDINEDTPSQENSKQTKRILKQVARKFKDVDNWELDFEEVTASSSSPLGAR